MSGIIDGLTLLLPPQAGLLRRLDNEIAASFTKLGFEEMLLPLVVDAETSGKFGKGSAVRFAAPGGGIAGLRDDMTMSAVKLSVNEMSSMERPLKVFYSGPVFRESRNRGTSFMARQEMSIGAEVFGAGAFGIALDAALSAIAACGDFKRGIQIRIGDIALLEGLLELAGLEEGLVASVKSALLSKDVAYVNRALGGLPGNAAASAVLELIPSNEAKRAIGMLRTLSVHFPGSGIYAKAENAISALEAALAAYRDEDGIAFELGLIRPLDYYTGNVFEAYAEGYGSPLLGGGQYDGLMRSVGSSESGAGFALDLGAMLKLAEEDGTRQ